MPQAGSISEADQRFMRLALQLARKGYGMTSPNPMVGALVVRGDAIVGRGWHERAGAPHAEVQALRDATEQGHRVRGATLYVTLEPCCTHGRTPPCTDAIVASGIRRVVVGATDPNPRHRGRGFRRLAEAGIEVVRGVLEHEAAGLNEAFNHWIVRRTPWVIVKSAMTLDGKIATPSGESKWITSEKARARGMQLRRGADAVLVGINTVLADDPSLTVRGRGAAGPNARIGPRRVILDSEADTPLDAQVISDAFSHLTTVVVSRRAPKKRVAALARHVNIWTAPLRAGGLDLEWVLNRLGAEQVVTLLVEGGGEVNACFLLQQLAHRIVFFYAPKVLGGGNARKAVAGNGIASASEIIELSDLTWKRIGPDLLLDARLQK